jgi:predicted AlkP superfamily phosphohydrolase/phosphomutase
MRRTGISWKGVRFAVPALALCLVIAASFLVSGCSHNQPADSKRIIVLGIDGMDPQFLERHWDSLPNLNRLRQTGTFEDLATTTPPQSPVAWSTVMTGMDPGGDGMFDFISRNPKTMTLYSSMAEVSPPTHTLSIGPYVLPLSKGHERRFLRGPTFWQILDKHGVHSIILRMPNNYPPLPTTSLTLSGMGTPDLRGTFGTFTYFTDDPQATAHDVPGGVIVPIYVGHNQVKLVVGGPTNSLRKDQALSTVTITMRRDPSNPVAVFEVQGQKFIVNQGEWSPWIHVDFPIIPGVKSAPGMFRIYAQKINPECQIYVTPVDIDPEDPALPISTPSSFSRDLAEAIGRYTTLGIPAPTAAWRSRVFDREEFERQLGFISDDEFRMLNQELAHFHRGVLFLHYGPVDQGSHMLWGKYESDLLKFYERVDAEVGYIRRTAPDATLMVISDHGFEAFNRAVNLNTWLYENGYLALDSPSDLGAAGMLAHVDWAHTKAYAVGLNSLYLNLKGRERNGIVPPSQRDQVSEEIIRKLEQLRDPKNGAKVVYTVDRADQVYHGPEIDRAPDMIVGWERGYRTSWETALGEIPKQLIVDNNDEWRGDHCIAAALVPGVFLSNRKAKVAHPWLGDIPVTLLHEFGVAKPKQMRGQSVF